MNSKKMMPFGKVVRMEELEGADLFPQVPIISDLRVAMSQSKFVNYLISIDEKPLYLSISFQKDITANQT